MAKIAIMGFGTVGSGVLEVCRRNAASIARRAGEPVEVKYILDVRDFPDSPYRDCFVKDFGVIESDPEVDIVVETIGGATVALDFTTRALKAGKSVVSSNKELVATHGYELLQLAREHGVSYLFEASVGGGIPILRPLTSCLAANELSQVTGILNGTTNYILTRMIKAGLTFEQALKEAQENGYAERDPSADVDGHDACRKICILAALAFGQHVYPDQVPTQGIRGVTLADVAYADSCGYKIKLLGRAIREPEGKVCAFVAPHLVSCENPLAGVEDVFNAISVTGNAAAVEHHIAHRLRCGGRRDGYCPGHPPGPPEPVGARRPRPGGVLRSADLPVVRSGADLHGSGPSGLRRASAPGPQRCARRRGRLPHRPHDRAPAAGPSGRRGGGLSVPRPVTLACRPRRA